MEIACMTDSHAGPIRYMGDHGPRSKTENDEAVKAWRRVEQHWNRLVTAVALGHSPQGQPMYQDAL